MIRALIIDRLGRRTGDRLDWMRGVADLGWSAFARMFGFLSFASLRGRAPADLLGLCRLGAVMAEGCGACVRIVAREAKRAGLAPAALEAALAGGLELEGREALAFRFGAAVAANGDDLPELGEMVERRLGRRARTALAVAAATARTYPAIKRGMGLDMACTRVRMAEL